MEDNFNIDLQISSMKDDGNKQKRVVNLHLEYIDIYELYLFIATVCRLRPNLSKTAITFFENKGGENGNKR